MNLSPKITQIIEDIEELKIQGATAVAENAFEGIKIFITEYENKDVSREVFLKEVEQAGIKLVNARPNEPLARNGLKYLMNMFRIKHPGEEKFEVIQSGLVETMDDFLKLLGEAKSKIVGHGIANFKEVDGVLTHCHSSTVENVIKGIVGTKKEGEWFSIVATETRPRYQGRITAKNLIDAGLEVLMIVDGAVTSFLANDWKAGDIVGEWGDWDIPTDAVFIGCDEIMVDGDVINKVGSYAVALAAYYASKPVYVVGTILKLNPGTIYSRPKIEMRDPKEIWEDAPAGLNVINPAFEIVPSQFITGFITEFGVIKPENVEREMGKHYDWMW